MIRVLLKTGTWVALSSDTRAERFGTRTPRTRLCFAKRADAVLGMAGSLCPSVAQAVGRPGFTYDLPGVVPIIYGPTCPGNAWAVPPHPAQPTSGAAHALLIRSRKNTDWFGCLGAHIGDTRLPDGDDPAVFESRFRTHTFSTRKASGDREFSWTRHFPFRFMPVISSAIQSYRR